MSPTLRPYQSRCLDAARQARRSGARRILLVAATGSGKSVMACSMIARAVALGDSVLVIGHRKELIDQFYVHLGRVGIVPGILRGSDERTDPSARVQVGTIQTLVRRDLPPASLVIVDEAHRTPGDSYARVLQAYPRATVLGLTATPCRLDGQPLAEYFDVLVESAPYSELIDAGAIVAPIVYAPRKAPDLSTVRKVAGDYDEGQLDTVMRAPHVIGDVVDTWLERAQGRRTVVFAVSVAHSKELCSEFQTEGVRAAHLDGTTPEDERAQILLDLETGKLQVVCNVGVLTEGWDQPSVKCCVMARPTLSLTFHMQTAGRVLRPWCPECRFACCIHQSQKPILLDHAGNVARHGLPHEDRVWSLDGKAKLKSETKARVCPSCYAYVEGMPCPLCGYAPPVAKRELRKAPGVLERIDSAIARERAADPQRAFYDAQVDSARKKGFKPGFASAKYKEKFGGWPPWAWSQATLASYDAEWRERVTKRERERAFWLENQAARDRASKDGASEEMLGSEEKPARQRVSKRKAALSVDAENQPDARTLQLPLLSLPAPERERSVSAGDAVGAGVQGDGYVSDYEGVFDGL